MRRSGMPDVVVDFVGSMLGASFLVAASDAGLERFSDLATDLLQGSPLSGNLFVMVMGWLLSS